MKNRIRFVALLLVLTIIIAWVILFFVDVYKLAIGQSRTLDEFGVIVVEADRYLDQHHGESLLEIKTGLLQNYKKRSNGNYPRDGWGHDICVNVSRDGKAIVLKLLSAGPDGAFGTNDDVIQQFDLLSVENTGGNNPIQAESQPKTDGNAGQEK